MYESFFHFRKRPFLATPTLERYFPASGIENAYQVVSRAIDRAEGPVAVMGGTGLGKSLLSLRIADNWQKCFEVILLSSSQLCTRRALLQNLLFELRMPYRELSEGELRLSLMDRLQSSIENPNDGVLLIIDEAQSLPIKLLEELRLITNIVRDGIPRVRLVLIGTQRLDESLGHPRMESLNQRLAARCYLTPLSSDETGKFIRHKVEICGANLSHTVTQEGISHVHRATDGIPRLIDQLMDHAFMLAVKRGQRPVSASLIEEAWAELQQMPLPWSQEVDATSSSATIEFGPLYEDDEFSSAEPEQSFPSVDLELNSRVETEKHSNGVGNGTSLKFETVEQAWTSTNETANNRGASGSDFYLPPKSAFHWEDVRPTRLELDRETVSPRRNEALPAAVSFQLKNQYVFLENPVPVNQVAQWSTQIGASGWNGYQLSEPVIVFESLTSSTSDTQEADCDEQDIPCTDQTHENERLGLGQLGFSADSQIHSSYFDSFLNNPLIGSHKNSPNVFGEDFEEEFDLGLPTSLVHRSQEPVQTPEPSNRQDVKSPTAPAYEFASVSGGTGHSIEQDSEQLEAELHDIISGMNLESMAIDPTVPLIEIGPEKQSQLAEWQDYPAVDIDRPEILSFSALLEQESALKGDDRDMLVIEEDIPRSAGSGAANSYSSDTSREPNPYCELFSKLRR